MPGVGRSIFSLDPISGRKREPIISANTPMDETKMENTNKLKSDLYKMQAGEQVGEGVAAALEGKATQILKSMEGDQVQKASMLRAGKIREAGTSLLSKNRSSAAAGGVDPGTGSAALINAKLARNVEADASQALIEGSLAKMNARFEGRMSEVKGYGSMLSSFAQAGKSGYMSKYYGGQ